MLTRSNIRMREKRACERGVPCSQIDDWQGTDSLSVAVRSSRLAVVAVGIATGW